MGATIAEMPKVIPLDEAAGRTGVSRRTLERWLSERRIKRYRIAGDKRVFVDPAEIERLREPRADPGVAPDEQDHPRE
jgi:excisionase family DNA binding protein